MRNGAHISWPIGVLLAGLALLGGCKRAHDYPEPPRSTSKPDFAQDTSTLSVPVSLSLDDLQRGLESRTPRRLWSIDEQRDKCVPGQQVKAFGAKVKITPDIGCRIVGQVTRGGIALAGSGQRITITMPVRAAISARNVGGVLKGETATGSAVVRADVRISMARDWRARAKVQISYGWTDPPGIDFLGQRIKFAQRADRELATVIAQLERDLQAEIDRVRVRPTVESAWKQGFAVINLNRERPPAWLRVTPTGLGLSSYAIRGRKLNLTIAAEAITETFVGDKPAKPEPTPLPPQIAPLREKGLRVFVPVVADYAQLEPVVLRALRKLAARGIKLQDIGHVEADFQKVTIYATDNGRLAVGIEAKVEPVSETLGTRFGKSPGRIWLTGLPRNQPDSQVIEVEDLQIFGEADGMAADLLIQLMSSVSVREEIAAALTQDFSRDYDRVLDAARRAIARRREGDFWLSATIDEVHHGPVQVTGAGLFLPAIAIGHGEIAFSPGRR